MIDPNTTTLGAALAEAARQWPEKTALIGTSGSWTWSALDREADRVAALLTEIGIRKGDVVGLCTTKRPEVVIAFFAIARVGGVVAPVNFKLEPGRVHDWFETCAITTLILEAGFDDVAGRELGAVGSRLIYVGLPGRYAGRGFDEAPSGPTSPLPDVEPSSPVYYNGTSGTTGRPKAAVATHAMLLWNARSGVEDLDFRADDVFLGMFSVFSHPHELFHRALLVGATCVVVDTMSPRVVCDLVARHRVSFMMAVPSFYEMMLEHGGGGYDLSSLRVLESGGAWVAPETIQRLEGRFHCAFMPVWGSTETHGVALALRPIALRKTGTTGTVARHYEVGVFDERGRPVAAGEVGELWVRGPAVATRYANLPTETQSAFDAAGWYHTADLVRQDVDGYVTFVGRRFDMLKVGGIRVFPLEIEQVLAAHPAVAEVCVVRAEERVRGEIPRAIVRLRQPATANDLRSFCRDHLAVYKVPRIVEIWDELPKLPNGKIDRQTIAATPPRPETA
jgi:long-chain acyl-CoA synthetase